MNTNRNDTIKTILKIRRYIDDVIENARIRKITTNSHVFNGVAPALIFDIDDAQVHLIIDEDNNVRIEEEIVGTDMFSVINLRNNVIGGFIRCIANNTNPTECVYELDADGYDTAVIIGPRRR